MDGTQILRIALTSIFALNGLLLVVILVIKPVHRRRAKAHDRRRSMYVTVLARHLALADNTVDMGKRVADDQAFLDALIDLRAVVNGPEAETLGTIVDTFEISHRQIRRLDGPLRTDRRLRAAVALAELADRSVAPGLVRHLSDTEQEIRIQCARGLARMRWLPAIPVILERFEFETPWVRSRFADALVDFGDAATWPLLSHIRINHRLGLAETPTTIRVLGVIGDPEAVLPLLDILDEATDPEVQIAIIESLGQIGAPMATDPVEKAARSEDWRLRAKAATALATFGDESVVPTLARGLEDENWWVRRNSASALARFPAGTDILYSTLLGEDTFAGDSAAEALGDAGEVISARDRIEAGVAARRDFELIEYVEGTVVTTS